VVSRLQNKESSLNDFHCSVGRAKFLDRSYSYSTHKDPVVKRWLGRDPRFEAAFYSARFILDEPVERFFRDLSQRRILPGSFGSAC
jgi:hypothetical protein